MFNVSSVPFYWYVEPEALGDPFEFGPWRMYGPAPALPVRVWMHDADGEIHGEAILMRALPWPRFRSFFDGKQVHLPYWRAIAFERSEVRWKAVGIKFVCACGRDHGEDRRSHFRIEVVGREIYATYWDNTHFENSFPSRAKKGTGPVRDKRTVSYQTVSDGLVKPPIGGRA